MMRRSGKLGQRGSTALEFAFVAPPLLLLLFGGLEYGRLLWTWQALQLAGDQTARCVAIGGTACSTPSTYAVNTASGFGALGLATSGVAVTNLPATSTTTCNPLSGNAAIRIQLSLTFTSPVATFIPSLNKTLVTTSCYPLTGN